MITAQPQDVDAVLGTAASFTVGATGSDLTYQWKKEGVDINGSTGATHTIDPTAYSNEGIYTVVVSNSHGSVLSEPAELRVGVPASITTEPVDHNKTVGSLIRLEVGASGTDPLTYQWYKGAAELNQETGTRLTLTNVQESDSGDYHVVVSNDFGGPATSRAAKVLVGIAPTLTVDLASEHLGALGSSYTFEVNATGTAPLTYKWIKDNNDTALSTAGPSYTVALRVLPCDCDQPLWQCHQQSGLHDGGRKALDCV